MKLLNGDLWLQIVVIMWRLTKAFNVIWSAAGTTNLLGSTLRIHPDNSDIGYSIPQGNFGEYFSAIFPEYLDTNKVKTPIYAQGQRSNFTSVVSPY